MKTLVVFVLVCVAYAGVSIQGHFDTILRQLVTVRFAQEITKHVDTIEFQAVLLLTNIVELCL